MKTFCQLLKHDICRQLMRHWYYFLVVCPVVLYFGLSLNGWIEMVDVQGKAGCLELIIYMFYGEQEYIPQISDFKVNIPFLLVHTLLAYMTAYYPVHDLSVRGRQIFIRIKNNTSWWYAKCIWLSSTVIIYYLVIFFTAAIFSGEVSKAVNENILILFGEIQKGNTQQDYLLYALILPIMASLAISFLQMTISILTAPVYGFFFVTFQLIISFYFYSPLLFSNYQMFNRCVLSRENGITAEFAVPVCIAVIMVCVVVGAVYMKKRDIF